MHGYRIILVITHKWKDILMHFSIDKALKLVVLTAAAMVVLTHSPAVQAAPAICKPMINAMGKPKPLNKPGWGIQAKKSAIAAWEKKVKGKYGKAYAKWSQAKSKDFDCVTGVKNYQCLAKAKGCKSVVAGSDKFTQPTGPKCKPKFSKWGKWYYKKADAIKSARTNWQLKAAAKYGSGWGYWGKAKNKDISQYVQAANKAYRYLAIASPCK